MSALPTSALVLSCLVATSHGVSGALEGKVLPFRQVELAAAVGSQITDMKVREGDSVKAGQVLATLYSRLEELEMQRNKLQLERKEFEAKSNKVLLADKVIPKAAALDSRIEQELARLALESANEQLKLRNIIAPIDGIVQERKRETGETVTQGQTLFRIVDLSKVYIQCAIKPEELHRVHAGMKVPVRLPQLKSANLFNGDVVMVDFCADASGAFPVKVLVDNPERLIRVGLKAEVELPAQP